MNRTGTVLLLAAVALAAQEMGGDYPVDWWAPSQGGTFPAAFELEHPTGAVGLIHTAGPVETKSHPFFEPLGTNGRACVTCHQPVAAMSVSAALIKERWKVTGGKDPIFAAIDGSNCPSLPQEKESSHSLLINRGLFRVAIPWPVKDAEFTIEVVRDPTGCNNDPVWGLKSAKPAVSVYRRSRVSANLRYVMAGDGQRLMADARAATLELQALDAIMSHMQARSAPDPAVLRRIVDFESSLYLAATVDRVGGRLETQGPRGLQRGTPGDGDDPRSPVFEALGPGSPSLTEAQREFRESVARGADFFMNRQFWIRDTANFNDTGRGNPVKSTCASCHNAKLTGQQVSGGFVDLGTSNYPNWTEPGLYSESGALPVFKITCAKSAAPHPFQGRTIYTTDPGRALISGRCADVGSFVMPQFRGLAARAPYFANGSAATLGDVVDYYDTRFEPKMGRTDKMDLINFLSSL